MRQVKRSSRIRGPGIRLLRHLGIGTKLLILSTLQLSVLAGTGVLAWDALAAAGMLALSTLGTALLLQLYLTLAFHSGFVRNLQRIDEALNQAADGDLTVSVEVQSRDELGDISRAIGQLTHSVSATVAQVRSGAALVAQAGQALVEGNQALSDRTEQEAANLEETTSSVQAISATVASNANTADTTDRAASHLREVAQAGASAMAVAVQSVEAVQQTAHRMQEITSVIDSLAFQTNILALNAAVEAARAGEHGLGFAVVASEVRALAQRSAASAREIHQLIGASTVQVETSVAQMRTAGAGITEIVGGVSHVADNMSMISSASAEQVRALHEIAAAIGEVDHLTQRNAQLAEQSVAQAISLQSRATALARAVSAFKLQQGSADEAVALVKRAMALSEDVDRATFIARITEPANNFHDRDLYVFVLDAQGAYLSFGGNPAKVGSRVQDLPGTDGAGLLDAIVRQADQGQGWVEYEIANPKTGKINPKMSYVVRLGDLYVGCGIYRNAAS